MIVHRKPRAIAPFASSPVARPVVAEQLEDRKLLSAAIALFENNILRTVDTDNPSVVLSTRRVTGLQRGDQLVGIDYRPATTQLYGLTESDQLFVIDPVTGRATAAGYGFEPNLNGDELTGFDFNPAVDRIRVVDGLGANARLNPENGSFVDTDPATPGPQADTVLAYAPGDASATLAPQVTGVAYSNNIDGAPGGTTLYGIDVAQDALVTVGSPLGTPTSPNTGQLNTVGPLGVDVAGATAFDILDTSTLDFAFAAMTTGERGARTQLYAINTTTGDAEERGRLANGATVLGLALVPNSQVMVALSTGNRISKFTVNRPDLVTTVRATGLARGERLVALDLRPANGLVYALGTGSRSSHLYTVDVGTGAATTVGDALGVALRGDQFGFDFNPTVDRIRLVTNAGQNLRLNPDTGAVVDADTTLDGIQGDGDLAVAGDVPSIADVAYTSNVVGATETTLYGIDTGIDALVTIGTAAGAATPVSPNTGQVFFVGPTGAQIDPADAAFDIVTLGDGTNVAYAALREAGRRGTTLNRIDLTSGETDLLAPIGRNLSVLGLTAI